MKKLLHSMALLLAMLLFSNQTVTAACFSDASNSANDASKSTLSAMNGDVNGDGFVDIDDVTFLISSILGHELENFNADMADINHDGRVDVDDITKLIGRLLGNLEPEFPDAEIFTVNGVTFKMILVEGGLFTMGATEEQAGELLISELPTHEVAVSSFGIGETEVTQALWLAVMGNNPSAFTGNLNHPVECVSWNDCQLFIAKLNELTGRQFHLPTEAEWEFSARGGNKSMTNKYAGSNVIEDVAWYWGNIPSQSSDAVGYGSQPVATKQPNELGLYDMSGNISEWCQDLFGSYSSAFQSNPVGPVTGYNRVYRSGNWFCGATACRVSRRDECEPFFVCDYTGLRLAIEVNDSPKFRPSETVVVVNVGEQATVDLLNGSGQYYLAGNEDCVLTTFNGNSITVTGKYADGGSIYIVDQATNAMTVLNVVVTNLAGQTDGEWAYQVDEITPAIVGQATNDHLFVRMDYDDVTYDNTLYFNDENVQTVWFWLDDDEIYNNAEVQALTPISCDMDGYIMYNEITYNTLQVDIYLPEGFELTYGKNSLGRNARFDWGPRMPFESTFSYIKRGTIVVDGITYNNYRVLLTNSNGYGSHLSANDEFAYEETGALKKDDGAVFALFIKNTNEELEQGLEGDMILANLEYSFREGIRDGWETNNTKFFYGTGGNNTTQRFQKYHRVKIHY